MIQTIAWLAVRACSRRLARSKLRLRVEGAEQAPESGPVLLVCRHYHHTYDGVALIATLPRPIRIVVAIDWASSRPARRLMEYACHVLRWPAVLRPSSQRPGARAFTTAEIRASNRRAAFALLRLLRDGELVAIFPEAYPNVDPVYTPKRDVEMLEFQAGFARAAALAARIVDLTIVPVGFAYAHSGRLDVTLRFGRPRRVSKLTDFRALAIEVESEVRALSGVPTREQASTQPRAVR